jgi:hypothetical protein
MKKLLMILSLTLILFSCEKENNETNDTVSPNLYSLPWKTEYIHYENIPMCRGNHSSGYKLFYKDSLLKEECIEFGAIGISDSLLVNDSILHIFFESSEIGSYDLLTKNGGYSWEKYGTGPPYIYKTHFVDINLVYCVTRNQNDLYFTGIGESNLTVYKDTLAKGTHYILDTGTNIIDIDSTLISINDSVDFVIKFKE